MVGVTAMRSKKMFVIRLFAVALLVLVANGQSARASVLSFNDGCVHQISSDSIGGGIEVSNHSVVEVYKGSGANCGSLDVCAGSVVIFNDAPQPQPASATVPEPNAIIIWSLLSSAGLGLGWWRKRNLA